jgi:hypothetical protein
MPEHADKLLPPVLTAMSAADAAVGEHDRLVEQLGLAVQEAARLDEELRAVDFADVERLASVTQAYAAAVSAAQRLSWREQEARRGRERSQEALAQARKVQSHARSELLRIELEIDAASIWDMVGRFEQQVRKRLEDHAALAAEMGFAARAAGEESAMALEASTLAPALGTSGPALWSALAGGVRLLYDKTGSLPGLDKTAVPADETPAPPVAGRASSSVVARAVSALAGRSLSSDEADALPTDTPAPPVAPQSDPPAFTAPPPPPAEVIPDDDVLFQGLPPVATPPPPVLARTVTLKAASTPPPPIKPVRPPPPPPGTDDGRRFDFGRPQAAAGKSDPPSFAGRAPRPPPARVESLPLTPENKRGRLDRMLRSLAGMVGPSRPPERARGSGDK